MAGIYMVSEDFAIYEVDAAIRETYILQQTACNEAIESGSFTTDHLIKQPEKFTLEGLHSTHPPIIGASLRVSPVRVEELDEDFRKLYEDGTKLDVFASLRWIGDMVITDYTVNRDADTGLGLPFTMTLQQIKTVDAALVSSVPVPSIPKAWPPYTTVLRTARTALAALSAAGAAGLIAWGIAGQQQ